ncbi:MAG: GAD domain-containing protein [Elusimicrobiota bacterium]
MKNLNDIFKESESQIVNSVIGGGGVIMGEKFKSRKGFFTSNYEVSKDIASKIEEKAGLKGFISTNELPKYGISSEEKEKIREEFNCTQEDVVLMVAGSAPKASEALNIIKKEIN